MPSRIALPVIVLTFLIGALSATVVRPLSALQRALPPRQVAVEWLTAKTVADALRHLPPATVEKFRAFQETATPEQQAVARMVEPMLAPLVFSQLMGGTLTTTGSPVSTIRVAGDQAIHVTVLDAATTGDSATVPLRVRPSADGREEAGAIELRREGTTWRIVAANLGSRIPLVRYDAPDYVQAAKTVAIEELLRERVTLGESMAKASLRALVSAQMAYSMSNGGFFAPPECLTDLGSCKASFKLDSPPLHAGALAPRGYAGRFYPGEKPSAAEIAAAKAVSQSLKSWAHVFSPTDAGSQARPICGDSTGRICRLPAGRAAIPGGVCPAACEDVK